MSLFNTSEPVTSGVPQGWALGPMLFTCVMGTLKKLRSDTVLVKFVDDITVIVPTFREGSNQHVLGEDTNVRSWARDIGLAINQNKSKCLAICKSTPTSATFLGSSAFNMCFFFFSIKIWQTFLSIHLSKQKFQLWRSIALHSDITRIWKERNDFHLDDLMLVESPPFLKNFKASNSPKRESTKMWPGSFSKVPKIIKIACLLIICFWCRLKVFSGALRAGFTSRSAFRVTVPWPLPSDLMFLTALIFSESKSVSFN